MRQQFLAQHKQDCFFKQHGKFSGCPNLSKSLSEEEEKTAAGKADGLVNRSPLLLPHTTRISGSASSEQGCHLNKAHEILVGNML